MFKPVETVVTVVIVAAAFGIGVWQAWVRRG